MHHSAVSAQAVCACTSLRKASRAVTRLYDEALAGSGMSIVQFSILRNLQRLGSTPLMQLADVLVMERTTLYRALGPLERHGWVAVSDGSGRAKSAALTRPGEKALAAATGAWQAAQQTLLASIGLKDWTTLEASLGRLVAATQGLPA